MNVQLNKLYFSKGNTNLNLTTWLKHLSLSKCSPELMLGPDILHHSPTALSPCMEALLTSLGF